MKDYRGCIGFYPSNDRDHECTTCDHLEYDGMCAFFIEHECKEGRESFGVAHVQSILNCEVIKK